MYSVAPIVQAYKRFQYLVLILVFGLPLESFIAICQMRTRVDSRGSNYNNDFNHYIRRSRTLNEQEIGWNKYQHTQGASGKMSMKVHFYSEILGFRN